MFLLHIYHCVFPSTTQWNRGHWHCHLSETHWQVISFTLTCVKWSGSDASIEQKLFSEKIAKSLLLSSCLLGFNRDHQSNYPEQIQVNNPVFFSFKGELEALFFWFRRSLYFVEENIFTAASLQGQSLASLVCSPYGNKANFL